ncbi:hypothetical protein NQ317_018122 [Molorchus minor]|uniref:Adenylyltransferase and sulfurtransferase MOCS3 homolog n=1 Tax=Molorchus minor TaxID=1323400 RepID=A0ABQ9J0L7_9CUCU|nr:hypothetical protein NQ317_018122 [Molorchus minor]
MRYSRQMIMPNVRVNGQIFFKQSKVIIIGAGGLGCPAALYLVCAGIGEITIVDYDKVELSNLHRQILHSEEDLNQAKVDSAYNKLKSINSDVKIIPIHLHANSITIQQLITQNKYDVVVDGSDNVATRYLLNDVCVMNNIPLVSGSALQMEGQLTVYHYKGGPCYRCVFPDPPPPQAVTNCGDGGVLGPVCGTIGTLQALETIKIISGSAGVLSGQLLLFDGSSTTFRNVKLRGRNPKCAICGENPTVTKLIDYEQFCQSSAHDKVINIDILEADEQVEAKEFSKIVSNALVLDVRPEVEYQMCSIPGTINFPYSDIEKGHRMEKLNDLLNDKLTEVEYNVYVLCRRGNDSQRAVSCLKNRFSHIPVKFYNIKGGLHAYSRLVDPQFPVY